MNYEVCLDYLYSKLPMFSRTGAAALKMDLSNTLAICESIGNPQNDFKTIHIAGTNGKGSVSHMLASILQEAGYKTGLYTSPHLYDFRERIKVNGQMIPKNDVIEFTEKLKPIIEELEPSFFEVTVGMAFDYFKKEHIDIAVIETGLGGRLDSTNIIRPLLSVITNIGMDHVQLLGDTLEKIAIEKAGIIKNETPIIIGRTQPETKHIFETTAEKINAPILFADKQYSGKYIGFEAGLSTFEINDIHSLNQYKFESDLAGSYQSENIATVITAIEHLRLFSYIISKENIYAGIQHAKSNTGLFGRWDMLHKNPFVFLDVAHNEDGIKKLLEQLDSFPHKHLHIILGMSKDKDVSSTLNCLPKDAKYYFTQAHLPRALEAERLSLMANEIGLIGDTYENANESLSKALLYADKNDLIIVCGSIFVVAEVDRNQFSQ